MLKYLGKFLHNAVAYIRHPYGVICLDCGFLALEQQEVTTSERFLLRCRGAGGCPLRNGISLVYIREFIRLFSSVLGTADVYELFCQRVEKYGEIFRNGEDQELDPATGKLLYMETKDIFYLSELILRTRNNTPPACYNFDHEPLTLKFEAIGVNVALMVWISTMLSGIIESLEIYCDSVGQQG